MITTCNNKIGKIRNRNVASLIANKGKWENKIIGN